VRKEFIMAKKTNTFTEAQVQEMIKKAVAEALANVPTGSNTGKGKAKDVAFTKHDGTVIYGTQAQVDAWKKSQDSYADRVAKRDENLKVWADKRETYKPSKALKDAIKANRALITHKVAKEQYGFVGTKKDLAALKDSICK
jgi:hypothetical protein